MTSITSFLWFDNNVPEAVAFYKSVFPNAKVETVNDFMAGTCLLKPNPAHRLLCECVTLSAPPNGCDAESVSRRRSAGWSHNRQHWSGTSPPSSNPLC